MAKISLKRKVKKPKTKQYKTPKRKTPLTLEETQTLSRVKRLNQRIVELEKAGLKSATGYKFLKKQKYMGVNLTSTSKSGVLKIRTDIGSMTKEKTVEKILQADGSYKYVYHPSEYDQLKSLLDELEKKETTITELKDEYLKQAYYEYENYNKTFDGDTLDLTRADVSTADVRKHLLIREKISGDAITKCFYMDGMYSDLYIAWQDGRLTHSEAVEIAYRELIHLYKTEGFTAADEPYESDIKALFYRGDSIRWGA